MNRRKRIRKKDKKIIKSGEKNQDNAWFGQIYIFYSFLRRKKNKIDINKSKAELSGLTYVKNFNYMID